MAKHTIFFVLRNMINLLSHNLIAYESAVEMLQEMGKAAIIHPTGTGKFFVAFKLCEDNLVKQTNKRKAYKRGKLNGRKAVASV